MIVKEKRGNLLGDGIKMKLTEYKPTWVSILC